MYSQWEHGNDFLLQTIKLNRQRQAKSKGTCNHAGHTRKAFSEG